MKLQIVLILYAVILTTGLNTFAQDNRFSNTTVKVQAVSKNVYMVEGQGGNIGVLSGADGVFIIDSQFAPLSEKIHSAIQTISDAPIRYLVNTHYHPDHIGGNENFSRQGTLILAHENVRKRMQTGVKSIIRNVPAQAFPETALPVITFDSKASFHINNEEVDIIYLPPAHTDGDAIVHFRSADVIHAGDVFRTTYYPIVDIYYGGRLDGIIHAHDVILELAGPQTRIIPGHGIVTDRAMVLSAREMIVTVRDRIRKMYAEGKTLEEVLAGEPTKEFDARWDSPDAAIGKAGFIERYYRELSGNYQKL